MGIRIVQVITDIALIGIFGRNDPEICPETYKSSNTDLVNVNNTS